MSKVPSKSCITNIFSRSRPVPAAKPRYDLLEKLGEGGAGSVFKAWDTRLQRYVAIKRLHAEAQSEGAGVGTDLAKEAAALSSLQHPNVVSVYDLDEIDGEPCVVMEFLNGETLEQTMRRGALNLPDFAAVARQTLEGLVAAHRLGVQHRDIKPSNIMVSWLPNGDFLVKMLDFGLADFTSRPHQQVGAHETETYGSVHFMAPEQFLRHPVDARTDLYSLGCVLYYALTASYPFDGRTMEDIINQHLRTVPTPIKNQRADVSNGLSEWIEWLMSRDAGHRPQHAQEALDMLLQVLAGKVQTLGKSRMLKTQQVVKPITTTVRTGPTADRPNTARVPTQTAPVLRVSAPPPSADKSVKPAAPARKNRKLALIAGGAVGVVALSILAAVFLRAKPTTALEDPNSPPIPLAVLWARADTGLKTDKGQRDAKLGEPVDYWADQATDNGPHPIHYINTRSKEEERLIRLPRYQNLTLGSSIFPVVHFSGGQCLMLATSDVSQKQLNIPTGIAENSASELTYALILKVDPVPDKMVILASASLKQPILWELYTENQQLWVGSPGKSGAVPIPVRTDFMGILLTLSRSQKQAKLILCTGHAGPTTTIVSGILTDPEVDRVRLGAQAHGSAGQARCYLKGDLAEVHLYQRLLSADDQAAFQQYFVKRYVP